MQDDKEASPSTPEAKYEDPFVAAIKKNPRPLSMVVIGFIGMPLVLWLTGPDSSPVENETLQQPVYESTPLPIERTTSPAVDLNTTPAEDLTPSAPPSEQAPTSLAEPLLGDSPAELPTNIVSTHRPTITLIIDDIGYNAALGERAIALPGAVTYAVLPHTPHGTELAELAYTQGKEVMLHAPMSNQANMALGPGALTHDLGKEEFTNTLSAAIEAVPHLRGVNNHMGSALTEEEAPMLWVMETLKEKGLYFVDSYTTAKSVAGRIAKENAVPTITRNIFLDNVQEYDDIDREFKKLIARARSKGVAVGIGHPYQATIDYLEIALPLLDQEGIDLVFASKMIELQKEAAITSAL